MFLLRYSEYMFEKKNVLLRRTFALAISMQKYGAMRKRNSFTSLWEDGPRRYDKPDHESETVWTPCKYGHPSYERQDASIYRGSISLLGFRFVFADTGGKYSDCSFETKRVKWETSRLHSEMKHQGRNAKNGMLCLFLMLQTSILDWNWKLPRIWVNSDNA